MGSNTFFIYLAANKSKKNSIFPNSAGRDTFAIIDANIKLKNP